MQARSADALRRTLIGCASSLFVEPSRHGMMMPASPEAAGASVLGHHSTRPSSGKGHGRSWAYFPNIAATTVQHRRYSMAPK